MGDAMVQLAQRSLGAVASINHRDAYRSYVHLDTEGGWLTGKTRLPQHTVKKLTCDGILQPAWHTQGAPVNVGRAQRIVPARTRRLVEDHDRGCRFPGCAATAYLECHHLIHWVDGGPTDTPNLCSLCPYHHDGHHDREFTIAGNADDPDGLAFTTPTHPATTTASAPLGAPQAPSGSPGSPSQLPIVGLAARPSACAGSPSPNPERRHSPDAVLGAVSGSLLSGHLAVESHDIVPRMYYRMSLLLNHPQAPVGTRSGVAPWLEDPTARPPGR